MLTLATPPVATSLTSVARVREELGLGADTSYDDLIDRLIAESSSEVHSILGRPLWRAQFVETRPGFEQEAEPTGLPGVPAMSRLVLSRFPIASLDAVTYAGESVALSEIQIVNAQSGILYRSGGFPTGGDPDEWSFKYTAGYFVVGDNFAGAGVSVLASDNSYNDSASGFHPLLRAGDWLAASAFANAGNNGRKLVEAATPAKIEVGGSLIEEAVSGTPKVIALENIPSVFSRAAATLAKAQFKSRARDPSIKSKSIDDVSTSYFEGGIASAIEAVREELDRYVLPL